METKDKINTPVVDENVNVENDTVANENNPTAENIDETKNESSIVDSVVKVAETMGKIGADAAKTVKTVTGGVAKTAKVTGKIGGTALKTAGAVVGGAAKSAGMFANLASFFFANIQTIMIAMAVMSVVAFAGYIVKDMLEGPKIEDTANIVKEVKKISELTTACYYEESVLQKEKITTKKQWFGSEVDTVKNTIVLTALCKVRAGFDLSMLGENDLVVKGDTVNIKLPAPKIFDVISNPSDYRIFEESGVWKHDEIVAMQVQGKERMLQNALENNILEKANIIGKERVATLFSRFGFNVINVTLSEVPARMKPATPVTEPVSPVVEEQTEVPAVEAAVEQIAID